MHAYQLVSAILDVTEAKIVPLLHESAKSGNMPFGAAILTKTNLHPVTVAANDARSSPLLHGETNCIRQFFEVAKDKRPDPQDCIFFATHEPCSLCLSGIAWTAFPTVYYLFTYQEVREKLGVENDVRILEVVFRVPAPSDTKESLRNRRLYNEENDFFVIKPVSALVAAIEDDGERRQAEAEVERIKTLWNDLPHHVHW